VRLLAPIFSFTCKGIRNDHAFRIIGDFCIYENICNFQDVLRSHFYVKFMTSYISWHYSLVRLLAPIFTFTWKGIRNDHAFCIFGDSRIHENICNFHDILRTHFYVKFMTSYIPDSTVQCDFLAPIFSFTCKGIRNDHTSRIFGDTCIYENICNFHDVLRSHSNVKFMTSYIFWHCSSVWFPGPNLQLHVQEHWKRPCIPYFWWFLNL